ncbi:hypothetical protein PIB30_064157 [Stylosanthes scabra]|uniref:Uncharacterized protein n=1 Tax=Stylosanthes scabra TaxID=79078 RepID=A0ABU6VKM0_9FABA|nr:hypothetical protein [Stylosanthes scabra]
MRLLPTELLAKLGWDVTDGFRGGITGGFTFPWKRTKTLLADYLSAGKSHGTERRGMEKWEGMVPAEFSPNNSADSGNGSYRQIFPPVIPPVSFLDIFEIEPTLPSLAIRIEGTLTYSPHPNLRSPAVAILRRAPIRTSEAPPSSSPSPPAMEKGALNTTKTHIWLARCWVTVQLTPPSPSGFPGTAAET